MVYKAVAKLKNKIQEQRATHSLTLLKIFPELQVFFLFHSVLMFFQTIYVKET